MLTVLEFNDIVEGAEARLAPAVPDCVQQDTCPRSRDHLYRLPDVDLCWVTYLALDVYDDPLDHSLPIVRFSRPCDALVQRLYIGSVVQFGGRQTISVH